MDTRMVTRINENLSQKRETLIDWLVRTPAPKKQVVLGPSSEGSVQSHLSVINNVLDQSADQTFGMCQVCCEPVEEERLEVDYTTCVCIDHLTEEEKRQLEYDLELAQSVQKTLLPQEIPQIQGMEVAAFSRPTQMIGGDYFDFLTFPGNVPGITIADVAGHGMAASLHMASIQTMLRTMVLTSSSPAEVLRTVNRLFSHNINFTTFVTIFISAYNNADKTITYCNAGHNPPLLVRGAGDAREEISWLEPTGSAIGLVEKAEYQEKQTSFLPGDVLVLYTDGVTEAINDQAEEFGPDRLYQLVATNKSMTAVEIVRIIRDSLSTYSDGQPFADDTTIVVCKATR